MTAVNLDAFEEDFDAALTALTEAVIARVDADTKGMTEREIAEYWVKQAREHVAELERLDAPDCILDHARSVLARREAKLEGVKS